MDYPNLHTNLQGINDAKGVPSIFQGQFQHTGPQAGQRLCDPGIHPKQSLATLLTLQNVSSIDFAQEKQNQSWL
jgi:hypothetical protein